MRGLACCLCAALLLPCARAAAHDGPAAPPGASAPSAPPSPLETHKPRTRARRTARGGAPLSAWPAKRASAERARGRKRPRKKSAYDLLMEGMHAAPAVEAGAVRDAPVRDLVLRIQGRPEPFVIKPLSNQGGFDAAALEVAKHAFGSWTAGPTPHPRVLELIYAAVLHFDVPYVYLISGVRKDRTGSRHSHGLAADVVFPGVTDDELAAYFRAQGFVGVGTYPRSGFVHVDTRDKSYFWVDRSAPGRRGRVIGVRAEEARAADEAAVARGNAGFVNPPRLQKALNMKAARRRRQRAAQSRRTAEPVKFGSMGSDE